MTKNCIYLVFHDNKNDPAFYVFSTLEKAKDFVQKTFLTNEEWYSLEQRHESILQWSDDSEYVSIYTLALDAP